jgi:hypothetical protein
MSTQVAPQDEKAPEPTPMVFTERDGRILVAIHAFDGLMGDYQIQRLFFTGKRQMQARMKKLWQNGYVRRPGTRRRASLDCMVYWLDERGAEYVAGTLDQRVQEMVWLKEPRWSEVRHQLAVNDVRIFMREACERQPALDLDEGWFMGERDFRVHPDTVEFRFPGGRHGKHKVVPDAHVQVLVTARGETRRYRLFLELDRGTMDNPRFVREKVLPGVAYLSTEAYERRLGHKSGLWLVVTTKGARRVRNLKKATEAVAGQDASFFFFTTFAEVQSETVFTASIWYRGGEDKPGPIFRA